MECVELLYILLQVQVEFALLAIDERDTNAMFCGGPTTRLAEILHFGISVCLAGIYFITREGKLPRVEKILFELKQPGNVMEV